MLAAHNGHGGIVIVTAADVSLQFKDCHDALILASQNGDIHRKISEKANAIVEK